MRVSLLGRLIWLSWDRKMTLKEIALVLNLSVEQVRRIEKGALLKLSHPRNFKKWQEIRELMALLEERKAKRDSDEIYQGIKA